jgi:hypothetical protein
MENKKTTTGSTLEEDKVLPSPTLVPSRSLSAVGMTAAMQNSGEVTDKVSDKAPEARANGSTALKVGSPTLKVLGDKNDNYPRRDLHAH